MQTYVIILAFRYLLLLIFLCTAIANELESNTQHSGRIFEATDEFQVVQEDQLLPGGLHIRLNVQTGFREAKKISSADRVARNEYSLAVTSQDQNIDLNDNASSQQKKERQSHVVSPSNDIGLIKKPQPADTWTFQQVLQRTLCLVDSSVDTPNQNSTQELMDTLDTLQDLSHDIYFGAEILKNREIATHLFCLSIPNNDRPSHLRSRLPLSSDRKNHGDTIAYRARSMLATALQNNDVALRYLESYWHELGAVDKCFAPVPLSIANGTDSLADSDLSIKTLIFTPTITVHDFHVTKSLIFLYRGLLRSPVLLDEFLSSNGMASLFSIFQIHHPSWATVHERAGELVLETFFEPTHGIDTNRWPPVFINTNNPRACGSRQEVAGSNNVRIIGSDNFKAVHRDIGCWLYYLGKLAAEPYTDGPWLINLCHALERLQSS